MVYGRMPAGGGGSTPDLSGEWVGHIDLHDNFTAAFEENNGIVTGTYDHDGGKFTGEFHNGYILGKIEYRDRISLAALRLTEEYELDGIYVPSPFHEMISRFDFNRYN